MDRPISRRLEKTRKLSFLQFSIQRSMGALRIGSNPWTKISAEWIGQVTLRKRINCSPTESAQLLFNEDGSLLLMADTERGCVRLFDTKRKQLVASNLIDLEDQWILRDTLTSGPNDVLTVCNQRFDSGASLMFWDLRNTSHPVSSSFFAGQPAGQSSLYSKKDKTILIMNPDLNSADRLSAYNREGVKMHTDPPGASTWTRFVTNVAMSPDESILVMGTTGFSYIIVRQLNLETLLQDLQNFDPIATLSEGLEGRNSASRDGVSCRAGSRAQSSRNVPEIMYHTLKVEGVKCLCQMCNKAVLFTPKSDHFIGRNTYLDAKERGGSPNRAILMFDLQEYLIQRRSSRSHLELNAYYDGNNLGTYAYLNRPLYEITIYEEELQTNAGQHQNFQPMLVNECTTGACNLAVSTLLDETVFAIADDLRKYVKFFIFNNEHFPVQELQINLKRSMVANMTFSPNNFSLVVSDIRNNLHWFDIEHCGPLVNNVRGTGSMYDPTPFEVNKSYSRSGDKKIRG